VRVQGKGINRTEIEELPGRTGLEIASNHSDDHCDSGGHSGEARESEKGKPSLGTGCMATTFDP
jgi:hypothetical protein